MRQGLGYIVVGPVYICIFLAKISMCNKIRMLGGLIWRSYTGENAVEPVQDLLLNSCHFCSSFVMAFEFLKLFPSRAWRPTLCLVGKTLSRTGRSGRSGRLGCSSAF
jgi:hypothetical protein